MSGSGRKKKTENSVWLLRNKEETETSKVTGRTEYKFEKSAKDRCSLNLQSAATSNKM